MKILIPVIALCAVITDKVSSQDVFPTGVQSCEFNEEVIQEYRKATNRFLASTYRKMFYQGHSHFVYSPLSAWITLAAISEGTEASDQEGLFQLLEVPTDLCDRVRFYQLATSRFVSSSDVSILSTRMLVIDEQVTMNPVYHNYIFRNSLLNVLSAPLRDDPQTSLKEMRRITSAELSDVDISGNSVLLNAVDYQGLWTTAFEDAIVERAPFYSQSGEKLGSVDLMKVQRRVKMAYVQSVNALAIELPIGSNDRYRIAFGMIPKKYPVQRTVNTIEGSVVDEFLENLRESKLINIAIPRINFNSVINIKNLFEGSGIESLWADPKWTRNISEPAALPSDFVQQTTLSWNQGSVKPASTTEQPSNSSDLDIGPILTKDYIANRPFLFGIFDAETYTCILSGAFTKPTYTD